jgi:hypothetical protein
VCLQVLNNFLLIIVCEKTWLLRLSSWEKMTHLNFVVILYKATQRSLAMSRRRTGPCEPESKGHRFDSARGPILLRFLGILKLARHLTNGVEISHWILRLVLLTYKYQVRFCIEGLSINAWEPLYHVLYESNRCDSLWNMLCMIAWNDCLIIILDGFGSLLCYHHTPSSLNHNISLFTPFWRDMQSDPGLLQFKPHNGFFI